MKVVDLKAKKAAMARKKYAALVLETHDRLFPEQQQKAIGMPNTLDTCPDVRRAAKSQL